MRISAVKLFVSSFSNFTIEAPPNKLPSTFLSKIPLTISKAKSPPMCHEGVWDSKGKSYSFLTATLEWGQCNHPAPSPPWKALFVFRISETVQKPCRTQTFLAPAGNRTSSSSCLPTISLYFKRISEFKVAGSIPGSVIGIFHWHNPLWPHYGPGFDSASNRNEYHEYFLGR